MRGARLLLWGFILALCAQLSGADIFCVNGKLVPQLFLLGAQKCGTTSLANQLHSEWRVQGATNFPNKDYFHTWKEVHYFDHGGYTLENYARHFPACAATGVTMDATPNYVWVLDQMRAIKHAYGPARTPIWSATQRNTRSPSGIILNRETSVRMQALQI